jgi:hypothetical protein
MHNRLLEKIHLQAGRITFGLRIKHVDKSRGDWSVAEIELEQSWLKQEMKVKFRRDQDGEEYHFGDL